MSDTWNAATHFIDANRHLGAKPAFVQHGGPSLSYGELAERVERAGNALRAVGLAPGERVLLAMRDTLDFPAVFWGAIKLGAIPVPVSTLLKAADYAYLLENSGAAIAVFSATIAGEFRPALAGQTALRMAIVAEGALGEESPGPCPALEPLLAAAATGLATAPTRREDVAFWLYSSGSTGKPKGALHRHESLLHTAQLYAQGVLGLRADDRVFSIAKLFFAYGLGNAMTFPLSVGATAILLPERPTPRVVMEVLRAHQPTVFGGVPTFFAGLLADPANGRQSGSTALRWAISAGEPLPRHLGEQFRERFGTDILDGLGSTEMLHIFCSLHPGDVRYGTSGKAVAGYELSIVTEEGREAATGELGELRVRGPSSAVEYWQNPERTRATFRDGWTWTGDKYFRDEGGYYVCCGRSDDMIKSGGIWVSPTEVEATLGAHPAVLEAAVVGAPDESGLMKPRAFVVLRDGSDVEAEELRAFVKGKLAPFKCPRWVEFVDALPKTATGKIQRYRLRQA